MNSKFAKSLTLISTACFLYKTRVVLSFFFSMRSLASTKRATRQTAGARSVTATTVTSLPPPAERGHGAPTQEPPKERDPSPRATRRARPDRRGSLPRAAPRAAERTFLLRAPSRADRFFGFFCRVRGSRARARPFGRGVARAQPCQENGRRRE